MTLAETQELMWRAITWPTGAADFLEQADAKTRRDFESCFRGSDDFSAVERLEVYANAYYWRLHDSLAETYPSVAWLLGPAHFRNLITDYLLEHPPTNPDLRHAGRQLASFLGRRPDTRGSPGLRQVASIEAGIAHALHAADAPPLSLEKLSKIPEDAWPGLRFELTAGAAVLECQWDYPELYRARSAGEEAPSLRSIPESEAFIGVLLWRQGHRVRQRALSEREAQCLGAIGAGRNFGELCASLAKSEGREQKLTTVAALAADFVRSWVTAGLLGSFTLEPPKALS
jgi:hypothetical protein